MCEVHARCPNCGQPNLDDDERGCFTVTLDGQWLHEHRVYDCHQCGAHVRVTVPTTQDRHTDGHSFAPDPDGGLYCAVCALPPANGRHRTIQEAAG